MSFLRRLTNSHKYGLLLVGNEVDILEENFSEALDAEVNVVRQSRLLCYFERIMRGLSWEGRGRSCSRGSGF